MKRLANFLALILVTGLLLSICGCSSENTPSTDEPDVPSTAIPAENENEAGLVVGSTVDDTDAYQRLTASGTLTIGTPRTADRMEPGNSGAATALAFVYETLFTYHDNEIVGLLAKDWEWSEDQTQLSITLHEGITFSNGEPCTPEDILYSLKRQIDVGNRMSERLANIDFDNCQIVDDTHFTIQYFEPYGAALSILSHRQSGIVCKSYVESMSEEDWWDKPVGTGPYVMTENISGSHASFTANENYWGGIANQPCVNTITLKYYSDSTTMFIDYENGVLDMIFELNSADLNRIIEGDVADTYYQISTAWDGMTLLFCNNSEPLKDIRVRQAIAMAINMNSVSKVALGSLADTNVDGLLPPYTANRSSADSRVAYDVDAARELLAQTEYADGLTLKLVVTNTEANTKAAEAINAFLAEIGITLEIEAYDVPTAMPLIQGGGTDLAIHSWGDCFDAGNAWGSFLSTAANQGTNQGSAELDEIINTGIYSVDDATRDEAFAEVEQYIVDNCIVIPICYKNYACAYRPYVSDVYAPQLASPDLRYFNVSD